MKSGDQYIINSLNRGCRSVMPTGGESELNVFTLPLVSQFRLLPFYGTADGTMLTRGFNLPDIQKRLMVIKSFRVVPYTSKASIDLYVNDGITTNKETIPTNTRIDRLFDSYNNYSSIRMYINGSLTSIFSEIGGAGHYPLDLWEDNIYYKIPSKIQGMDVAINGLVVDDIENNTTSNPLVKVLVGVYLYNEQG